MKTFILFVLLVLLGGCYSRYQAVHLYYGERVHITAEDRMNLSVDGDAFVIECEDNKRELLE